MAAVEGVRPERRSRTPTTTGTDRGRRRVRSGWDDERRPGARRHRAQTAQAVANLDAVLDAAGLSPADLAELAICLTDPADVEPFVGAAAGGLPSPPAATTMLIVNGLASPELRVEIEAIAAGCVTGMLD
jgi:enamine deaminase RidA (YjgF/YER057c/UK114 family)